MKFEDMRSGLLVQDGRTVLKISTVEHESLTAQVMLEDEGRIMRPPRRTKVRTYAKETVEVRFSPASKQNIARMGEVYRNPMANPMKPCPRCQGTGKVPVGQ